MAQPETKPFKPTNAGSWATGDAKPKRVRKTKPSAKSGTAAPKRVRKTKPAAKVAKTDTKTADVKTAKVREALDKKAKVLARQAAAQIKREEREAAAKAKADAAAKVAKKASVSLARVAKEVNVRFEKAMQADGKADDHRLAAAIHLAAAKDTCGDAGINFKKWAEENVTQGYETVRKMLAIGSSDNPEQAMADLRAGNKAANQKARDNAKASITDESDETPAGMSAANDTLAAMKKGFSALSEDDQMDFIEWASDKVADAGH